MTTASLLALDASRWSAPKVPSVVQNRVAALPFIPVGEVSYRPVRALLTPERADDRGDAGARAMVGFLALFCTMFAVYLAIGAGQVVGVRRAFAAASRVQQAERAREATERRIIWRAWRLKWNGRVAFLPQWMAELQECRRRTPPNRAG